MRRITSFDNPCIKNSEDRLIAKIISRYVFHSLMILLFALALNWCLLFQGFIIQSLSNVKFAIEINVGSEPFLYITFFVALCYRAGYLMLKRSALNEYFIPLLLLSED